MTERHGSQHDDGDDETPEERGTGRLKVPLETQLAIHDVRLATGQKTFAELRAEMTDIKSEIASVKQSVAPKPPNWTALIFGAVGIIVTILTAWWALADKFSERPTREEIETRTIEQKRSLDDHAKELRTVREQQTEQRVIMDGVRRELEDTSRKIDVLLLQNDRSGTQRPR